MSLKIAAVPSPFDPIWICEQDDHIVAIHWKKPSGASKDERPSNLLAEACEQLTAYFERKLQNFDLPLNPSGDAFQQAVCKCMLDIPYGETTTYGAIADKLGTFGQPVGKACGGNSIPIVIPCHRVLAADGLGGYSGDGGVERKIALLKHEGGFPLLL